MFSVHLRKFDELPYKTLLMVAAGLVILCQLAAMVFVADSQVAKAKMRDDQRRAELLAISQCMETRAGAARQNCIQQARAATNAQPPAADGASKAPAFAEASASAGNVMPAHPARSPQGLMAASFSIR
ncbi:hypothetical protein ACEN8I_14875 [Polaromonas sp. CT11-55]|uniref:hypothetical protein n=1 Tax=Polaromonas sp. CT11-55 TaxID=3243045 RepID=UPI0039A43C89